MYLKEKIEIWEYGATCLGIIFTTRVMVMSKMVQMVSKC